MLLLMLNGARSRHIVGRGWRVRRAALVLGRYMLVSMADADAGSGIAVTSLGPEGQAKQSLRVGMVLNGVLGARLCVMELALGPNTLSRLSPAGDRGFPPVLIVGTWPMIFFNVRLPDAASLLVVSLL